MARYKSCLADKHLVSTVGMTRDEWLSHRRKSIGGSDAAGIVGLSKWSSQYSVWADKTGRLPDKPDSEAMRQGRDLEDYVARRWMEETGHKVRRLNAMIYNPSYPHSHADVDRWVVGENAGLECKTTSAMDLRKFDGVEFPEQYYCQCVHYMAVTGAERWYLAVLVFGRGFYTFTLDRDDVEKEIACLMASEYAFWEQYVKTGRTPRNGWIGCHNRGSGDNLPGEQRRDGRAFRAGDAAGRIRAAEKEHRCPGGTHTGNREHHQGRYAGV